jgi:hypothetical protein
MNRVAPERFSTVLRHYLEVRHHPHRVVFKDVAVIHPFALAVIG